MRQFDKDRQREEKEEKRLNNLCKCTFASSKFKQVIHANAHISPDTVYLHAKGRVSNF